VRYKVRAEHIETFITERDSEGRIGQTTSFYDGVLGVCDLPKTFKKGGFIERPPTPAAEGQGADSDVHREPTSLTQLIESAVSEARKLHGDRGIQFEIDIAHQDPISLDPAKIKRMLANIIENGMDALNGSGRLWVKTRQDKTGNIVIEIGNNGPTIPTDEIPFLFEPFFTRRKKSGTGLGLAIARKVVEGHGGQLTCVSSVETSTVFIAKVPS